MDNYLCCYYNTVIFQTTDEQEAENFITDNGGYPYNIKIETQE